jgi:hypothetical protein
VLHDWWRFTVEELDGRRIRTVRIRYVPENDPLRSEHRPGAPEEAEAGPPES